MSSRGPRASRRRRCSLRALIVLGTKKGRVEAMCVLEVQPGVSAARSLLPAARNEDSCDEPWLVAKAKSGHEDPFGELYKRHQLRTYRTALRILRNHQEAEDPAQSAF